MTHIGFSKHTLLIGWISLSLLLLSTTQTQAQTVSQFDFNSTAALMTATVGPNGTAINPATVAPTGVAYITAGCGGLIGMDLVVPGATFDLANIRIRANFQRGTTEGTGSFFLRGALEFGFAEGSLFAVYRVYDGLGGFTDFAMFTSHNVSTTAFHEYEFNYDNCTGNAQILDNGIVIASQFSGMGRDLYWIGAGDAMIGANLDNACNQSPGYDYAIIGGNTLGCLILPVEWGEFTGKMTEQGARLNWTTLIETNNNHFLVEHSADGILFSEVTQVPAVGNSEVPTDYQITDPNPFAGQTFYRLRQVDTEGLESHSEVIEIATNTLKPQFKSYPNPSTGNRWLEFREMPELKAQVLLHDIKGVQYWNAEIETGPGTAVVEFDWTEFAAGMYFLQITSGPYRHTERITIQ